MSDQRSGQVVETEKHIVFHPIHIDDLLYRNVPPFTIHTDEDGIGMLGRGQSRCLRHIECLSCLFDRGQEFIVSDRLQQEVERIHLVALKGIFLESGSKHHTSILWQDMSQFHTVDVRHLNVEEQQFRFLCLDGVDGSDGVCIRSHQLQLRRPLYVRLQQAHCQGLVIDNHAGYRSHSCRVIFT